MNGPMLVFGAGGQIGRELMALAPLRGMAAVGLSRSDADIADTEAVAAALARHRPAIAINAAGYTAVDLAESEPQAARVGNVEGPAILAMACASASVPLVHLSTDYVFNGEKAGAYVEDDAVAPLSVYGQTKAEGEMRVRDVHGHHVILRTSWVFGVHGSNFLKTVLRLAAEQDELRIVADQFGCPTASADIAEAILALAPRLIADAKISGTYHFAGSGSTNWHEFAVEIVARQRPFTDRNPPVIAINAADYPARARRPKNSVLDGRRFRTTFGYVAHPWRERAAQAVKGLLQRDRAASS